MAAIQKKPTRLAMRLSCFLGAVLFVALMVLTVIIAFSSSNSLIEVQKQSLTLLAENNAKVAKGYMQSVVDRQVALAAGINTLLGDEDAARRRTNIESMIEQTQSRNPEALSLFYVSGATTEFPSGYTVFATSGAARTQSGRTVMIKEENYEASSKSTAAIVLDPYKKTIDGREYTVITVLQPVTNAAGVVTGVLGSDIDIALLNGADYASAGYKTFYNLIICGHQTVILNTKDASTIGSKYVDIARSANPDLVLNVAKEAKQAIFVDASKDGTKDYRACVPFYVGTSKTVWLSVTSVSESELMGPVYRDVITVIIVAAATLILLAVLTYICINRALKPLGELEAAARAISKGNLHATVTYRGNDEVGSLAESLRESMRVLDSYVTDIDRAMSQMASGDFDVAPSQPFIGDFKSIEDSISRFIVSMCTTLSNINDVSQQVSVEANQVSSGGSALADGAAEQAASIEQLSATVQEIASQVRRSSGNANAAKEQSEKAGTDVEESNARMQEMIAAMSDITAKSAEIRKIVKTIEDIAFQTNILALNAAVEAARAGAAGKGFAVVADEVRNLAGKSAEAAKNTTRLIEETVRAVEGGSNIAGETADAMVAVVDSTRTAITQIEEIAQALEAQTEATAQITIGLDQISAVVQTNSATAQESSAASQQLSSQAHTLKEQVSRFKLKKF